MQHDEVIWQTINQGFCSYKVKTVKQNFCKHPQNVTGLCLRQSCPLANSRYATIVETKGICYLWLKTIERAHTPRDMWEKIKLPANYQESLAVIDSQLAFWPNFIVHKSKQRLTKIHQYLMRMRKLKLKLNKLKLVGVNKKVERREATRELKAEKAAKINEEISKELLARLQAGTYDGSGMYLPEEEYSKVLDLVADENEEKQDQEQETNEEENEEEDEDEGESEAGDGVDLSDSDEFIEDFDFESDLEDFEAEREIEFEYEIEGENQQTASNTNSNGSSKARKKNNDKTPKESESTHSTKRKQIERGGGEQKKEKNRKTVEIKYDDE